MPNEMERGALQIINKLTDSGFAAYKVGGYVRDVVLGRRIKDIDITTSALPEQVIALFDRTIPTGLQHGTVTVGSGGFYYEVTTFRQESEYIDYRRPSEVQFVTDLTEDLRRRDFTMNAMAMDADGAIIDPFNGRADMDNRLLRCVGAAAERFTEDALRMLRCIRFAAEYGLSIEESTWQALIDNAELMRHIAMERVRAELERMIGGGDPNRALQLLLRSGLLRHLKASLPVAAPPEGAAVWADKLMPLTLFDSEPLRWAYVAVSLGLASEQVRAALKRLTFSNERIQAIAGVVAANEAVGSVDVEIQTNAEALAEIRWKRSTVRFGDLCMRDLLALYNVDSETGIYRINPAEQRDCVRIREIYKTSGGRWLEEMPAKQLQELAVTSRELLGLLGGKPGPWLGRLLAHLLDRVAIGALANDSERLAEEAKVFYKRLMES
jgi:tRNA nucleotidyltransferase (CCA-adding enzyme)